jgi:hypothetical protein
VKEDALFSCRFAFPSLWSFADESNLKWRGGD